MRASTFYPEQAKELHAGLAPEKDKRSGKLRPTIILGGASGCQRVLSFRERPPKIHKGRIHELDLVEKRTGRNNPPFVMTRPEGRDRRILVHLKCPAEGGSFQWKSLRGGPWKAQQQTPSRKSGALHDDALVVMHPGAAIETRRSDSGKERILYYPGAQEGPRVVSPKKWKKLTRRAPEETEVLQVRVLDGGQRQNGIQLMGRWRQNGRTLCHGEKSGAFTYHRVQIRFNGTGMPTISPVEDEYADREIVFVHEYGDFWVPWQNNVDPFVNFIDHTTRRKAGVKVERWSVLWAPMGWSRVMTNWLGVHGNEATRSAVQPAYQQPSLAASGA